MAWIAISWFVGQGIRPIGWATGLVSGLFAISAGAGLFMPQSAFIAGIVGGSVGALVFERPQFNSHDERVLRMFGVQTLVATVGLLMSGVFSVSTLGARHHDGRLISGWIESGNAALMLEQAIAIAAAASLSVVATALILTVIIRIGAIKELTR